MSEGLEAAAALKSEIYNPSSQVVANANVPDYLELRKNAYNDPLPFWDARAKELVDWYEPYTQLLDSSDAPHFKWFVGGKTKPDAPAYTTIDMQNQRSAQRAGSPRQ